MVVGAALCTLQKDLESPFSLGHVPLSSLSSLGPGVVPDCTVTKQASPARETSGLPVSAGPPAAPSQLSEGHKEAAGGSGCTERQQAPAASPLGQGSLLLCFSSASGCVFPLSPFSPSSQPQAPVVWSCSDCVHAKSALTLSTAPTRPPKMTAPLRPCAPRFRFRDPGVSAHTPAAVSFPLPKAKSSHRRA